MSRKPTVELARCWVSQCAAIHTSPDDIRDIIEALNRLSSPLIITAPFLSQLSLYTLLSNEWLCDEHLNACGKAIDRKLGTSKITIVDTFHISSLRQAYNEGCSWPPQKPHIIDKMVSTMSVCTLLVPVHTPGHWSLLVVDITSETYSYTDTLNLDCQAPPGDVILLLNWWFSSILARPYVLKPVARTFSATEQEDSHSCGPAVMSTMAHIALSTPLWIPERSCMHRIRWFLEFTLPVPSSKVSSSSFEPQQIQHSLSHISTDDKIISISDSSVSESEDSGSSSEDETLLCSTAISGARKIAPLPPPQKYKQTTLGFSRISREEWLKQENRRKNELREMGGALEELEQSAIKQKKLIKKEKERLKKQRQRAQKRAKREATDAVHSSEAPTPAKELAFDKTTPEHLALGVAELSRPHRHSKHVLCHSDTTGADKLTIEEKKPAKRINWMHPFLWTLIDQAAHDVGYPWRPMDIERHLKLKHPSLFAKFSHQRISDWRDSSVTDRLKWKDHVITATQHGNNPRGENYRRSILHEYPEIIETTKLRLNRLRDLGIPLTVTSVRAFMIAIISSKAPELFKRRLRSGVVFQCSNSFVRSFLHTELNWSLRRPTRAAQNTPANVDKVLLHAFLRMACTIRDHEVPSCCIVNADQTQVVYSHGCQYTWAQQGAKQVPVVGKDEKRAYTLVVGVSNSGIALPFQAIYSGLTSVSLPHPSSPEYAEAIKLGFRLELSMTKTYWATQETMRSYVTHILAPYFQEQIRANNLPEDQMCIFQIDAWSVHRSAEFRAWMATNYPWIRLQYIPGGCTGLFQACDVGIQRVVKIAMRQQALCDLIEETSEAIDNDTTMETFKNNNLIKTLRDRSVSWMVEAYKAIDKPDLVRKAFALCAVPNTGFNLSYDSLTSRDAKKALMALMSSDPELYAELTMGKPAVPEQNEPEGADEGADEPLECSVGEFQEVLMQSSTAGELEMALSNRLSSNDADGVEEIQEPGMPVAELAATDAHKGEAQALRRSKRKRSAH